MGVHLGINDDLTEKQKAELEIDDVTHFILRKQKSSGIVFTDANFYKYQIYFTPYQATSIIFHLDPYKPCYIRLLTVFSNTDFWYISTVLLKSSVSFSLYRSGLGNKKALNR